jgi:DNA-binding transcriptional ArsR family regulator
MSNDQQQRHERQTAFDTETHLTDAVRDLAAGTASAVEQSQLFNVSELFELLSHPGRRYILTYLLQSEGYVTCSELVDHVVAVSDHTMTDQQFRKRVTAELTHSHLPKLEQRGLIDYNTERQIVSPTAATPTVRPYLRIALAQQQIADEASERS